MTGYILSVLGIIIAGVLIDVIIPNGTICKYVKSIYSIFVVAVLINPIFNLIGKTKDFTFKYDDFKADQKLLEYICNSRAETLERKIENVLDQEGFENVDIILNFSVESDVMQYNSCMINLENLSINKDKQHINKYEFIKNVVKENTNLTEEEIIINEWQREKTTKQTNWTIKKH